MFDVGDYVTNFGVLVEQEKFQMTIFLINIDIRKKGNPAMAKSQKVKN